MRLDQFLALESDTLVVSVHAGRINDVNYDSGTIGRIARIMRPDEPPEIIIHFTRTLAFDFARLEKRNWEILKHCSRCGALDINLAKCGLCSRPDYCLACLKDHDCHIPVIGLSREPRREKLLCLSEPRSKLARR